MAYRLNPFTGRPDNTSDTMTGGWYIGTKDTAGSWKIALEGLNLAFYAHEGGSYVKKFAIGVAYPIAVAASAAFIALSATDMTVDNSLYVGGNVGIGIVAPQSKLSVMGLTGEDTIATFGIAGSTSVVVDKNGNVGIGTSAPASLLQVGSGFRVNSAGQISRINNTDIPGSWTNANLKGTVNGNMTYGNASSNPAALTTIHGGAAAGSYIELRSTTGTGTTDYTKFTVGSNGATEAMRIVNAGNVGIGTTLPTSKFSVMAVSGSDTIATFGVAGSNSVVIDKNGNVGIGTSAPSSLLDVGGKFIISTFGSITRLSNVSTSSLSSSGLYLAATNTTIANTSTNAAGNLLIYGGYGTGAALRLKSTLSASASGDYISMGVGVSGNTEAMRIVSSGNIGIGTTTPGEKLQVDGNIYPKGGSYLSGDGTIGVTVTTCTGFKNGICISGT